MTCACLSMLHYIIFTRLCPQRTKVPHLTFLPPWRIKVFSCGSVRLCVLFCNTFRLSHPLSCRQTARQIIHWWKAPSCVRFRAPQGRFFPDSMRESSSTLSTMESILPPLICIFLKHSSIFFFIFQIFPSNFGKSQYRIHRSPDIMTHIKQNHTASGFFHKLPPKTVLSSRL